MQHNDESHEDAAPVASSPTDETRIPAEHGVKPTPENPDPAPEADDLPTLAGEDRGGTGAPVGADNILEGRVGGVMGPDRKQGGQGQGG
jgi:hypothetical protein